MPQEASTFYENGNLRSKLDPESFNEICYYENGNKRFELDMQAKVAVYYDKSDNALREEEFAFLSDEKVDKDQFQDKETLSS